MQVDIPGNLASRKVPPMMLLTLVENALKHGLGPLPEGGAVRVSAIDAAGRLVLSVADNGRGLVPGSGGGTGLANIRARLQGVLRQRRRADPAPERAARRRRGDRPAECDGMTTLRIGGWLRGAVRDMRWRDIGFAIAIGAFPLLFGPHGGGLLTTYREGVDPLFDPAKLPPIVPSGRRQHRAPPGVRGEGRQPGDRRRVPRWLAYGTALLIVGVVRHLCNLTPLFRATH